MRGMAGCARAVALTMTVGAFGVQLNAAPPPTVIPDHPPNAAAATAAAGHYQLAPDILVNSVWIGGGIINQAFTPFGRDPKVGETIYLGCDIGIKGTVPALAFKVAWYIDGAKTCGEGSDTVQNPPVCEFAWPLTVGTKVFITYVPHQAGTHTYKCAVDVGNQVAERSESNNSREMTFKALRTFSVAPPAAKTLQPGVVLGPKLQGY